MLAAGRTDGVDMATDAIEGLTEDHFTATPHKVALRSYKRLNESGEKIDLLTLTSDLERLGALESAGGFAYLAECSKNTPSFANLSAYCEKLREMYLGRRMTTALQVGIRSCPNHPVRVSLTSSATFRLISPVLSTVLTMAPSTSLPGSTCR